MTIGIKHAMATSIAVIELISCFLSILFNFANFTVLMTTVNTIHASHIIASFVLEYLRCKGEIIIEDLSHLLLYLFKFFCNELKLTHSFFIILHSLGIYNCYTLTPDANRDFRFALCIIYLLIILLRVGMLRQLMKESMIRVAPNHQMIRVAPNHQNLIVSSAWTIEVRVQRATVSNPNPQPEILRWPAHLALPLNIERIDPLLQACIEPRAAKTMLYTAVCNFHSTDVTLDKDDCLKCRCAICLCAMNNTQVIYFSCCKNEVHYNCWSEATRFMSSLQTCPLCRSQV